MRADCVQHTDLAGMKPVLLQTAACAEAAWRPRKRKHRGRCNGERMRRLEAADARSPHERRLPKVREELLHMLEHLVTSERGPCRELSVLRHVAQHDVVRCGRLEFRAISLRGRLI